MRPLLLAASIAALALPAVVSAQQPARPADGGMTRADALARADQRFDRIDTDHDGRITAAELAALPGRRGAPPPAAAAGQTPPPSPEARGPRRGGGARMFQRADANNDGVVTRDEFRAQAAAAFDRQDANRDGTIDATERQQWRGQRGGGMARHDAKRGGTITRADYQARALARFDRLDLNKDGRLDPAERQQHHRQHAERRAQG